MVDAVARVRRIGEWSVLLGAVVVVAGVLVQAFTIAAYVRGAGDTAFEIHDWNSITVHIGQLMIVIGALVAWYRSWRAVVLAVAFLVLGFVQVPAIGDTDESGGWINGLHGLLAVVILLAAVGFGQVARRELGLTQGIRAADPVS